MKLFLENLCNIKIRDGFLKPEFHPLLKNYFNIKDIYSITKNEGIELIKFINSSNTKLSESFYLLRKGIIERKNLEDPINYKKCAVCNSRFSYREKSESSRMTCKANGCTTKYNNLIGIPRKPLPKDCSKNTYKTKLINTFYKVSKEFGKSFEIIILDLDTYIKKAKKLKIIPLNFGISELLIVKYFSTIKNFKNEYIRRCQWQN